MNILEVIHALDEHRSPNWCDVTATTPNGTYTFDVVAVEGGTDGPVLRLVERQVERVKPVLLLDTDYDVWVQEVPDVDLWHLAKEPIVRANRADLELHYGPVREL